MPSGQLSETKKIRDKSEASAFKRVTKPKKTANLPAKDVSQSAKEDISDEASGDEEQQIESDSEEEDLVDVDEIGMERLMKALGDDGLDEYAQAALRVLAGEQDEDEEGSGDEDEEIEGDGDQEDEGEGEDEGEQAGDTEEEEGRESEEAGEAIPLDEVESVDEDVVATQKVEIDNKVCRIDCIAHCLAIQFTHTDRYCENTRQHKTRLKSSMDRNARCVLSRNHQR